VLNNPITDIADWTNVGQVKRRGADYSESNRLAGRRWRTLDPSSSPSASPSAFNIHETREEIQRLQGDAEVQSKNLSRLVDEIQSSDTRLKEKLAAIGDDLDQFVSNLDALLRRLQSDPEEQRLLGLARIRRELITAQEEWKVISSSVGAEERRTLEQDAGTTRALLDQWRNGPGQRLDDLVEELSSLFPDLPRPVATNPELTRSVAARAVSKELERCASLLSQDTADTNRTSALDQELERVRARARLLDQQLASVSSDAGGLAQTLAALIPHLHTEDCPVCGRDFREVSAKPLRAHVSDRISELTQNAGRLEALSREKTASSVSIANLERELNLLQGRRISDSTRNELKSRRARLEELNRQLADLVTEAQNGMGLIARASAAARKLDDLRSRDLRAATLRTTVSTLAETLSVSADSGRKGTEEAALL
jgi:DNA repair protein SbcC/Rad50